MEKVLLVEDSKFFANIIQTRIQDELGLEVIAAGSVAEARMAIADHLDALFLGLLDLNLPDGPDGEIIDVVAEAGIPAVVFTGQFDESLRAQVMAKQVIDYVLKDNPSSLDYVVALVGRLKRNRDIKALVVDDSRTARMHLAHLLRQSQFQVIEAAEGGEALDVLEREEGIKLVVTDYNMEGMDGFTLTKRIRSKFKRDELAVIGMSAQGNDSLSARFIKNGANDFITKPFSAEEFMVRLSQNVELIEQIEKLRFAATRDFLTGLRNRRSFFEEARAALKQADREGRGVTVAMIDVDFFKRVNDTYGHDGGDVILVEMAAILKEHFPKADLVARFGGEEFCALSTDLSPQDAEAFFESLRAKIEANRATFEGKTIEVTASIGVCTGLGEDLDGMISQADLMLYQAKEGGRNRVVFAL